MLRRVPRRDGECSAVVEVMVPSMYSIQWCLGRSKTRAFWRTEDIPLDLESYVHGKDRIKDLSVSRNSYLSLYAKSTCNGNKTQAKQLQECSLLAGTVQELQALCREM